jgi:FG-GAP repeat
VFIRRWSAVAITALSALGLGASGLVAAPAAHHAHPTGLTQFKLTAPVNFRDGYASSTAAAGRTVVVGAGGHKVGSHTNAGVVFVFTRPVSGWQSMKPVATLSSPNPGTDAQFGESVAISGRTIVVGAKGQDSGTGAVYVYTEPKNGWKSTTHPAAQLSISSASTGDQLGDDVAISGNTIVAGASGRDVGSNTGQGAVFVFTKPASGWHDETEKAALWASDGVANDNFGESADIAGNTIVAGSQDHNSLAGDADVFVKPASGWADGTETTKLLVTGGLNDADFGFAVSISGNTVAVGAPTHAGGGNPHGGAVFIYQRPAGGWAAAPTMNETAEITEPNRKQGYYFGISTDILGGVLLVGAYADTIGANEMQGAVYLAFRPAGGWTTGKTSARLVATDGQAYDLLGTSVAIGDGDLVGGAVNGGGHGNGVAYLWAQPRPRLTRVSESHKRWRLGSGGPQTNPEAVPSGRGSVFRVHLDQAAKVSMVFREKRHGHYKHVGTLRFAAHVGKNTEYVAGRLGHGHRLRAGHCKVTITVTNDNGQSGARTLRFRTQPAAADLLRAPPPRLTARRRS